MTTSTELPPTNNYMAEKMAEAEDPMRSIALEVDTRRRKILEDLAEIGADVEQTYQAVAIDEDALDGGINTHGDEYSVDVSYDIKTRPWRQQKQKDSMTLVI
jgi:hypothetical protein